MSKIIILILGCALVLMFNETSLHAQILTYYKPTIKELTAAKYQGRGYAKCSSNKAGKYLEKEIAKAGADEVVCQPFKLDINTYVGNMELSVDGRKQTPVVEYLFTAVDLPREDNPDMPVREIKVYVTVENGAAPVFTNVVR